jgi:hypothetical protein
MFARLREALPPESGGEAGVGATAGASDLSSSSSSAAAAAAAAAAAGVAGSLHDVVARECDAASKTSVKKAGGGADIHEAQQLACDLYDGKISVPQVAEKIKLSAVSMGAEIREALMERLNSSAASVPPLQLIWDLHQHRLLSLSALLTGGGRTAVIGALRNCGQDTESGAEEGNWSIFRKVLHILLQNAALASGVAGVKRKRDEFPLHVSAKAVLDQLCCAEGLERDAKSRSACLKTLQFVLKDWDSASGPESHNFLCRQADLLVHNMCNSSGDMNWSLVEDQSFVQSAAACLPDEAVSKRMRSALLPGTTRMNLSWIGLEVLVASVKEPVLQQVHKGLKDFLSQTARLECSAQVSCSESLSVLPTACGNDPLMDTDRVKRLAVALRAAGLMAGRLQSSVGNPAPDLLLNTLFIECSAHSSAQACERLAKLALEALIVNLPSDSAHTLEMQVIRARTPSNHKPTGPYFDLNHLTHIATHIWKIYWRCSQVKFLRKWLQRRARKSPIPVDVQQLVHDYIENAKTRILSLPSPLSTGAAASTSTQNAQQLASPRFPWLHTGRSPEGARAVADACAEVARTGKLPAAISTLPLKPALWRTFLKALFRPPGPAESKEGVRDRLRVAQALMHEKSIQSQVSKSLIDHQRHFWRPRAIQAALTSHLLVLQEFMAFKSSCKAYLGTSGSSSESISASSSRSDASIEKELRELEHKVLNGSSAVSTIAAVEFIMGRCVGSALRLSSRSLVAEKLGDVLQKVLEAWAQQQGGLQAAELAFSLLSNLHGSLMNVNHNLSTDSAKVVLAALGAAVSATHVVHAASIDAVFEYLLSSADKEEEEEEELSSAHILTLGVWMGCLSQTSQEADMAGKVDQVIEQVLRGSSGMNMSHLVALAGSYFLASSKENACGARTSFLKLLWCAVHFFPIRIGLLVYMQLSASKCLTVLF